MRPAEDPIVGTTSRTTPTGATSDTLTSTSVWRFDEPIPLVAVTMAAAPSSVRSGACARSVSTSARPFELGSFPTSTAIDPVLALPTSRRRNAVALFELENRSAYPGSRSNSEEPRSVRVAKASRLKDEARLTDPPTGRESGPRPPRGPPSPASITARTSSKEREPLRPAATRPSASPRESAWMNFGIASKTSSRLGSTPSSARTAPSGCSRVSPSAARNTERAGRSRHSRPIASPGGNNSRRSIR